MTKRIRLQLSAESISTVVSNIFIDKYMAEANGSYIKVYIYLLRCLSDPSMDVSVSDFSDKLDETEKDIIRALKYWEKKKLLAITWDADGQICNLTITQLPGMTVGQEAYEEEAPIKRRRTPAPIIEEDIPEPVMYPSEPEDEETVPVPVPAPVMKAPNYTPSQIASLKEYDDFDKLLDYVETRLGTLNQTKLNSLAFIYEILDMNSELIRYLYDYCSFKGKTGSAYLEKIAIDWKNKEIDTVDKARRETFSRSKECSAVKNSFGLQRTLGGVELEYISKWSQEYKMTPDLIKEACDRTLIQANKPDFKYADRILKDWYNKQVKEPADVEKLDAEHRSGSAKTRSKQPGTPSGNSSNKFSQFPQRTYSDTDYEELERKKLANNKL
ncbi:MAG: DnaD domain protein [Lachnospiraceae bacterium]|nr:DnaD domain protein [Lachnospiraceae bacterium]